MDYEKLWIYLKGIIMGWEDKSVIETMTKLEIEEINLMHKKKDKEKLGF